MSIIENNTTDEEYSLYLSFKEKPGILAGILTFVVSVTTLIVNFVHDSIMTSYFSYWGFSSYLVKLPSFNSAQNVFRLLGFGFLLQIIGVFFVSRADVLLGILINYRVAGIGSIRDEDKTNELTSVTSEILFGNDCSENEVDCLSFLRENERKARNSLIRLCLFSFVLFSITNGLYYGEDILFPINKYAFYCVASFFVVILFFLLLLVSNQCLAKKKRKESGDSSSNAILCSSLIMKYLSLKESQLRPSFYLSNRSLKTVTFIYVFSIISIVCISLLFCNLSIRTNKTVLIFETDEKSYSVIYQDGNTLYLNEMAIDDGNDYAYVSTSLHRVISLEDTSYTTRKFSKVIPCEVPLDDPAEAGLVNDTCDIEIVPNAESKDPQISECFE